MVLFDGVLATENSTPIVVTIDGGFEPFEALHRPVRDPAQTVAQRQAAEGKSIRRTRSPTGSTQRCPRPFVSSHFLPTHTCVANDMCKLVPIIYNRPCRSGGPRSWPLTEIDGRNFCAVLLRVEAVDTILLATPAVRQPPRRVR